MAHYIEVTIDPDGNPDSPYAWDRWDMSAIEYECAGQSCHLGGLVLPDGDPWPTHSHGLARWVRKVRLVEPEWREATNE